MQVRRDDGPPNQLAIGLPAKPLREVREEERLMVAREHERTASKAERYKAIHEKK